MTDLEPQIKTKRAIALWLWWIAATALGGAATGALEASGLQFIATLVLSGGLVGIPQWLVLRRYGLRLRWWAIATCFGWIAGSYISTGIVNLLSLNDLRLFYSIVPTVVMAIAQAFVLHRLLRPIAAWLTVNALGGALNSLLSSAVCAAVCQPLIALFPSRATVILVTAIIYGLGWAAHGAATGAFLARQFRTFETSTQR